jgi:hypothetical protein
VAEQRDYRKFLGADGRLHARYLPRKVYTQLVTAYRQDEAVIDEVFEELYFAWDLTQELERLKRAGQAPGKALAAQRVLDQMDDDDWWRVTSAFERVLQRDFASQSGRWTELLDPAYDALEELGWKDLQP